TWSCVFATRRGQFSGNFLWHTACIRPPSRLVGFSPFLHRQETTTMSLRIVTAAMVVLCATAAFASAGEISNAKLSGMGLSGMQQLSDVEGLAIRGKGTHAAVWGASTATYDGPYNNSATSSNGYVAGASHHHGSSSANGANLSFAGNVSSGYHGSLNF